MKSVGLFLGVEPSMGGLFAYAQSLLEALRLLHDDGCRIEVAYVDPSWAPALSTYPFGAISIRGGKRGLRLATLAMHARLPGPVARSLAWHLSPIPQQLARLDCDLWVFPAQDTVAYQVRLPVVGTVHDLMHRYESSFPEVSQYGRGAVRDHRFRNILSWARAVLVDSELGRQHVVESYGTDPGKVFPLPYVPPSYIYGQEPEDFDRRYTLPRKFILYPARFLTHKNHKRLISAAAAVRSRVPDISLVFTGSKGEDYDAVRNHAIQLGMADRITFGGYVPPRDIVGFYRRARAMVMPTFFGPTNLPPLEAFASGCPAAVSNIYAMPEQANGAALLFDPNSVEEMAAVIERLWVDDDLCRCLSVKGHQNIERWGQQQFSEGLRDTLQRVVAGRGSVRR